MVSEQFFEEKVLRCFQSGSILHGEYVQINAPVKLDGLSVAFRETSLKDQEEKYKI